MVTDITPGVEHLPTIEIPIEIDGRLDDD